MISVLVLFLFIPFLVGVLQAPPKSNGTSGCKPSIKEYYVSDELKALKPTNKKFRMWKGKKRG